MLLKVEEKRTKSSEIDLAWKQRYIRSYTTLTRLDALLNFKAPIDRWLYSKSKTVTHGMSAPL